MGIRDLERKNGIGPGLWAALAIGLLGMFVSASLCLAQSSSSAKGQYALIFELREKTEEMRTSVGELAERNNDMVSALQVLQAATNPGALERGMRGVLGAVTECEQRARNTRKAITEIVEGLGSVSMLTESANGMAAVRASTARIEIEVEQLEQMMQSGSSQVAAFADMGRAIRDAFNAELQEAQRRANVWQRQAETEAGSQVAKLRGMLAIAAAHIEGLERFYGIVRETAKINGVFKADKLGFKEGFVNLFGDIQGSQDVLGELLVSGNELSAAVSGFIADIIQSLGGLDFGDLGIDDDAVDGMILLFSSPFEGSCETCTDGVDNDGKDGTDFDDPKCAYVKIMFKTKNWDGCH